MEQMTVRINEEECVIMPAPKGAFVVGNHFMSPCFTQYMAVSADAESLNDNNTSVGLYAYPLSYSGRNSDWQTKFLIAIAAVALFNFVLVMLQERYNKRIAGLLALKGNISFLKHLLALPMPFFAMRYVGDLQQRQHLNQSITHSLVSVLAP